MAKNSESMEVTHNSIAAGTEITGDIKIKGNIRFEGTLNGNLEVSNKVVVGQSGNIIGNITCEDADIMGTINGNMVCSKTLTLRSDSKVDGEINTDTLIIEAGTTFNGTCKMGDKSKKV